LFLSREKFTPGLDNYKEFLMEFTKRNPHNRLSGPAIIFPTDGVVSVFSAWKFGRIFGKDAELKRIVSDLVEITKIEEAGSIVEAFVIAFFRQLLHARRQRTDDGAGGPAAGTIVRTTASGRRTPSARHRTTGTHFAASEVLWCTTRQDGAVLYAAAPPSTELALAMRRILGLPTMYRALGPATGRENVLSNIFFRIHFTEDTEPGRVAARAGLRKPTVFSEGFSDVYGTFWGSPPGDGWGRTVTLCVGDANDGDVGLPEAVVMLDEILSTTAKSIGQIPPSRVPGPRAQQVQVGVFAQRRHRDTLSMTL
jgi:hypothetical protein